MVRPEHDARIFLLDPGLTGIVGHYFEYICSIAISARKQGLGCIVACHRDADLPAVDGVAFRPVYTDGVWATLPGEEYCSVRNVTAVSERFTTESRGVLQEAGIRAGDIVFLPNIASAHGLAPALLAEEYAPLGVTLWCMYRYPRSFFDSAFLREAFRRLEAAAEGRVRLCTDSHRLADDLGPLGALPFHVLPIPHTNHIFEGAFTAARGDGRLHLVSLGNGRDEKGIVEIFEAIRLSAREPWARDVRFTLQVNNPYQVEEAIAAYRAAPDPRVTLVDEPMDSAAYYELLASSDVVLVPYWQSTYRDRTSGVFLEGLLAGKVLVCTQDTWMSDLLAAHGGGVGVADRSPESICAAIARILRNRGAIEDRARQAAAYWRDIHSSANLIAHLQGAGVRVSVPHASRAVVFFPWGDAITGRTGATRRLGLLVRQLESHYAEVRILFASQSEPGGLIGRRSQAIPYRYLRIRTKILIAAVKRLNRMLGGKPGQEFQLWYHLWPYIDPRFQERCRELVAWADDVFVEYPYFVPTVRGAARALGRRVTVTPYDIVSDQARGVRFIGWATRRLEMSALRSADRVVVVSANDRRVLADAGLDGELIPHPIDTAECSRIFTDEEAELLIACAYDLDLAGRRVCFFVGSNYPPNVAAARRVHTVAARLEHEAGAGDVVFVVAGGCLAPQRTANFVALGTVENCILNALYARCNIFLIPLTEGTGTSVKSIEALARGSLILSTSLGMRGIPVENGRHCLIEDEFGNFPARILELLADPARSAQIRREAAVLGGGYDWRVLFAPYTGGAAARIEPVEEDGLARRRREAIDELYSRLEAVNDPGKRAALARLSPHFGGAPASPSVDEAGPRQADPPPTSPPPPAVPLPPAPPPPPPKPAAWHRPAAWRRAVKWLALALPPIARVYRELQDARGRLDAQHEVLRLARANETFLRSSMESMLQRQLQVSEQQNAILRDIDGRVTALEPAHRLLESLTAALAAARERIAEQGRELEAMRLQMHERMDRIDLGSVQARLAHLAADIDRRFSRIDDDIGDLIELGAKGFRIPRLEVTFQAERPVALDSADHLVPRGTRNDNTRHPRFVRRCEQLLGEIRHLDIGCAGGGLVWDFTVAGHFSIGVEGSDYSVKAQRAEWRRIPERLFTADVCFPFHATERGGKRSRFNVITAWELFEHIPTDKVGDVIGHIVQNAAPGALLVCSIATFQDEDAATGTKYHRTVRPREWWLTWFTSAGFVERPGLFATDDFVRGSGNPRADDWDVRANPEMGFHLVLQLQEAGASAKEGH
jgi:glycosyltransferase involved in cell wall biosynthesis/2-polyprenyl-3-methyl-5-hydroxy-6-metoxy-1,4-benzoquinol methylase